MTTTVEIISSDLEEEIPIYPTYDPVEVASVDNPGDDLLKPQNCQWEKVRTVITVDVVDRVRVSRWDHTSSGLTT